MSEEKLQTVFADINSRRAERELAKIGKRIRAARFMLALNALLCMFAFAIAYSTTGYINYLQLGLVLAYAALFYFSGNRPYPSLLIATVVCLGTITANIYMIATYEPPMDIVRDMIFRSAVIGLLIKVIICTFLLRGTLAAKRGNKILEELPEE